MSTELIQQLEYFSFNAWPAVVIRAMDGWQLRFNWGVTRRANSVWPNEAKSRRALNEKLTMVEDFYSFWRYPARYQICPAAQPSNLDTILAKRGYASDALTAVQIAPLNKVLAHTVANPDHRVTVSDTFDSRWFQLYCQTEQFSGRVAEVRQEILQRIRHHTGYALLQIENRPVAVGLAVAEQDWVGIFCMTTHPDYRRQGAATAILRALAKWGQECSNIRQIYLQVMENNPPALALYAKAGFETLYHYHYRESPAK
jgi:RimJ/RimL family protein N-acetyltransferase